MLLTLIIYICDNNIYWRGLKYSMLQEKISHLLYTYTLYIKPLEENKILVSPGAMSKPGWESRSVSNTPC